MHPEIFTIPLMPTVYIARHENRAYRFFAGRWSDRIEMNLTPLMARSYFSDINRCICNDYPERVFNQLVLGEDWRETAQAS